MDKLVVSSPHAQELSSDPPPAPGRKLGVVLSQSSDSGISIQPSKYESPTPFQGPFRLDAVDGAASSQYSVQDKESAAPSLHRYHGHPGPPSVSRPLLLSVSSVDSDLDSTISFKELYQKYKQKYKEQKRNSEQLGVETELQQQLLLQATANIQQKQLDNEALIQSLKTERQQLANAHELYRVAEDVIQNLTLENEDLKKKIEKLQQCDPSFEAVDGLSDILQALSVEGHECSREFHKVFCHYQSQSVLVAQGKRKCLACFGANEDICKRCKKVHPKDPNFEECLGYQKHRLQNSHLYSKAVLKEPEVCGTSNVIWDATTDKHLTSDKCCWSLLCEECEHLPNDIEQAFISNLYLGFYHQQHRSRAENPNSKKPLSLVIPREDAMVLYIFTFRALYLNIDVLKHRSDRPQDYNGIQRVLERAWNYHMYPGVVSAKDRTIVPPEEGMLFHYDEYTDHMVEFPFICVAYIPDLGREYVLLYGQIAPYYYWAFPLNCTRSETEQLQKVFPNIIASVNEELARLHRQFEDKMNQAENSQWKKWQEELSAKHLKAQLYVGYFRKLDKTYIEVTV